ncbi:hypothetical protein XELAEV_18007443mg [Xenopus laevis]|uniref:Secreted protein n=1 Tax=Xenopus laevis TaxID=8355 RepID=A0A974E0N8_XENLA|nr:hypothetical protein XELAEV_18007443mg [Xenopus laevis]
MGHLYHTVLLTLPLTISRALNTAPQQTLCPHIAARRYSHAPFNRDDHVFKWCNKIETKLFSTQLSFCAIALNTDCRVHSYHPFYLISFGGFQDEILAVSGSIIFQC